MRAAHPSNHGATAGAWDVAVRVFRLQRGRRRGPWGIDDGIGHLPRGLMRTPDSWNRIRP